MRVKELSLAMLLFFCKTSLRMKNCELRIVRKLNWKGEIYKVVLVTIQIIVTVQRNTDGGGGGGLVLSIICAGPSEFSVLFRMSLFELKYS